MLKRSFAVAAATLAVIGAGYYGTTEAQSWLHQQRVEAFNAGFIGAYIHEIGPVGQHVATCILSGGEAVSQNGAFACVIQQGQQ